MWSRVSLQQPFFIDMLHLQSTLSFSRECCPSISILVPWRCNKFASPGPSPIPCIVQLLTFKTAKLMHCLRESLGRRLVFPNKSVGLSIRGSTARYSSALIIPSVRRSHYNCKSRNCRRSRGVHRFVLYFAAARLPPQIDWGESTCHLRGIRGNAVMVSLANAPAKSRYCQNRRKKAFSLHSPELFRCIFDYHTPSQFGLWQIMKMVNASLIKVEWCIKGVILVVLSLLLLAARCLSGRFPSPSKTNKTSFSALAAPSSVGTIWILRPNSFRYGIIWSLPGTTRHSQGWQCPKLKFK